MYTTLLNMSTQACTLKAGVRTAWEAFFERTDVSATRVLPRGLSFFSQSAVDLKYIYIEVYMYHRAMFGVSLSDGPMCRR